MVVDRRFPFGDFCPSGEAMKKSGGADHGHQDHHHHDDCHPRAGFFAMCVEAEIFQNCPADHKVDSADCKKLVEFVEKCKPM